MPQLTLSAVMAGIIFSAAGLFVIRHGKKNNNILVIAIGATMMVYTYFTASPLTDWGIGIALSAAAYNFWDGI